MTHSWRRTEIATTCRRCGATKVTGERWRAPRVVGYDENVGAILEYDPPVRVEEVHRNGQRVSSRRCRP